MKRVLLVAVGLAIASAACRGRATREWRADDHDEEPGTSAQVPAPAAASAKGAGDDALAEATWRSSCAICHGVLGRGDGPNGPMVKAPDLVELQGKRTDDELASVIRSGKGKMPAFPQLPPTVVSALVRRIRAAAAVE